MSRLLKALDEHEDQSSWQVVVMSLAAMAVVGALFIGFALAGTELVLLIEWLASR